MKQREHAKKMQRVRLFFAMLIFSSMMSVCAVAKYVLTKNLAFAVETSGISLEDYVRDGLVWSMEDGMLGAPGDNYTLTMMFEPSKEELLGIGAMTISSGTDGRSLEITTGYCTADGAPVILAVPYSSDQDAFAPVEVAIQADLSNREIRTFVDNHLVQVHTLEEGCYSETGTFETGVVSEHVQSAFLYDRILQQSELAGNYFIDLLKFGTFQNTELPGFLQKSSVLRLYSVSETPWEDVSPYAWNRKDTGTAAIENGTYQGIVLATGSNASILYDENFTDLSDGHTVRYVVRINPFGSADKFFATDNDKTLSGGFTDGQFLYEALGETGSIDCGGAAGRMSVVITASADGIHAYINGEERLVSQEDSGDFYDGTVQEFTIVPSGGTDAEGDSGFVYEIEVYDRVLSPLELEYLYARDEKRYNLDNQSVLDFLNPEAGDIPVYEGEPITFTGEETLDIPDVEGYEFSHWYCTEYHGAFMDEEFDRLLDAMGSDGYPVLHLRPVYTALPCLVTLYNGDGSKLGQFTAYYGTLLPKLPKGDDILADDGTVLAAFTGWESGDGYLIDMSGFVITSDLDLYPVYEEDEEEEEKPPGASADETERKETAAEEPSKDFTNEETEGDESEVAAENDRPETPEEDGKPEAPEEDGRSEAPEEDGKTEAPEEDGKTEAPEASPEVSQEESSENSGNASAKLSTESSF